MHTEAPRSKQLTLPSTATLPLHHPSHLTSPSLSPCTRTPDSRPFSSALHRSATETPLVSYIAQRHLARATRPAIVSVGCRAREFRSHTVQIPLSSLSSPNHQPGAVGGCFNSTTKIKCVPLPTIYNQLQMTQRGVRSVGLHAMRYLPSTTHDRTISDSLIHLPALVNRQKLHMLQQENCLQKAHLFKATSSTHPHRTEQPFYMSGSSMQMLPKEELPPEELDHLKSVQLTENSALYYGRGISTSSRRLQSQAVQNFEARLRGAIERNRETAPEEELQVGYYSRAGRLSRALTPASPIMEEGEQQQPGVAGYGEQPFLTQSQAYTIHQT